MITIGTGLLLVVNIIYGYFEAYNEESETITKKRSTLEF